MLVSYKWLGEFIETGLSPEGMAEALTMAGLEVEGLEEAGDDHVLEVNVTPNRPDCLSILGIARELHAITSKPLKLPDHEIKKDSRTEFRIEIENKELCSRYTGRIVRGVTVEESPEWLKTRLEVCGIRSVNNIVDITNYVLLEMGHPLHAFDLDTLEGGIVRVASAGKDQRIITIDGVERELPEDALLIWDGSRPVAIAGVMGGLETEVRNSTRNILIESAWFKPVSVRRTSKALGLRTESSYRFERGTDIVGLETALNRAALLVSKIAGGNIEFKVDAYPVKFRPETITLRYAKIRRILGTEVSPEDVVGILKSLELGIQHVSDEILVVTPPSWRPDLTVEADIIEEIARLYGYGRIPTSLPSANIAHKGKRPELFIRDVKEALRKEGLSEAINYSFMNEKYLDLLGIPADDRRRKTIAIRNPLRAEDAVLRTMLVPSLIENFMYNFSRGTRDVRIFEISRVFEDTGDSLPAERRKLGAILYREKKPSLWKETAPDFYILKGALESLFERLNIEAFEFKKPTPEPFLHPGKSAEVFIEGTRAGFIGELSPEIMEKLDVKTRLSLELFEIDMGLLLSSARRYVSYKQIPKFPAVERDLAIVVDESAEAAAIARLIRNFPAEVIEDVLVFDSFTGGTLPSGKKSLGFSIRYRSSERTLTDEEVEALHKELVGHLAEKTGGEIRA